MNNAAKLDGKGLSFSSIWKKKMKDFTGNFTAVVQSGELYFSITI